MTNILDIVKFGQDGLIPVITQDIRTDEVLMLAYMNEQALRETIRTGMVHYYSRSRQKLWLKGETSGHYQKVRNIRSTVTMPPQREQTGAARTQASFRSTQNLYAQPGIGTDMVQTDESSGAMEAKTDSRAEIVGMKIRIKQGLKY